jgi:hypothetical protein
MKKVLFWILFVPIGLVILCVAVIAGVFDNCDQWLDRITRRYENWSFDRKK